MTPSAPKFVRVHRVATYVVAAVVLFIAFRVEYLNARAGGVLPRHEYRGDDPSEGLVKWRRVLSTESDWRRTRLHVAPGESRDRPLTPAEQAQISEETENGRTTNALYDYVSTLGLLQYPLPVLLAVASVRLLYRGKFVHATAPILVLITAGALAFYRGYLSSLGW